MKKLLLTGLAASTLLMGCGDDKPPQECYDMIDTMIAMADKDPTGQTQKKMPSADEMIKEMETEWKNMSEDKRKEGADKCKQANAVLSMAKSMQ